MVCKFVSFLDIFSHSTRVKSIFFVKLLEIFLRALNILLGLVPQSIYIYIYIFFFKTFRRLGAFSAV